jgi:hypothetical protein
MSDQWSSQPVDWSIKDVGAPLLDSIATGLYSKLEVFREYVQNAVDSYIDFESLTGRVPINTVQVMVDTRANSLIVFDQGVGMDQNGINTLKAIAVSPKLARQAEFAGFRGLGIWSGLSACEYLIIRTTKVDVPYEYRLVMNCKDIVDRLEEPISIDELLQDRFTLDARPAPKEQHFTFVKLQDIMPNYGQLASVPDLTRYAEQYLPVPFDPNWPFSDAVRDILSDVEWSKNFALTINGTEVFRRFPNAESQIKRPERWKC